MAYSGRDEGGRFAEGNKENLKQLAFGVGHVEWLDSKASEVWAYWRAIEYGTGTGQVPSQLGREIAGGWGGVGGGRGARHGQLLTPFGGGSDQQFIPYGLRFPEDLAYSERRARMIMRKQGHKGRSAKPLPKGVAGPLPAGSSPAARGKITKEILAHEAYVKAWEQTNVIAQEKAAMDQIFGSIARQAKTRQGPDLTRVPGQVNGFLSVRVLSKGSLSTLANDLTSDAVGSFRQRLLETNRVLAEEMATAVADNLTYVRPGVSTGRLKAAILNPRNRFPQ